jgi:hypothetical protein
VYTTYLDDEVGERSGQSTPHPARAPRVALVAARLISVRAMGRARLR